MFLNRINNAHPYMADYQEFRLLDNLHRVSILWGEGRRPKGPRTTPLYSRPYGIFTRKDGEPSQI